MGGWIPLLSAGRERHAVESTVWIELVWCRVRFRWEATR